MAKRKQKSQHKVVAEHLKEHSFITNEIVQELLSVKQTRAYAIIREMIKEGIIVKSDSGKENNKYILTR